jgi:hypothetical protein
MTDFEIRRRILGLMAAAPLLGVSGPVSALEFEGEATLLETCDAGVEVAGGLVWYPGAGAALRVWQPSQVRVPDASDRIVVVMADPNDSAAYAYAQRVCATHASRRHAALLVAYEPIFEETRPTTRFVEPRASDGYCTIRTEVHDPEEVLSNVMRRLRCAGAGLMNADAHDLHAVLREGRAGWREEHCMATDDASGKEYLLESLVESHRAARRHCRPRAALLSVASGPEFSLTALNRLARSVRGTFEKGAATTFLVDHEFRPSCAGVLHAQLLVVGDAVS